VLKYADNFPESEQKALDKIKFPQPGRDILVALLSADFLFLLLHVLRKFDFITNALTVLNENAFSISTDLGLAESFQYLKYFWIAGIMLWLVYRYRRSLFLPWSFLYLYLLFDDMLGIHERVGGFLARAVGYDPKMEMFLGLRAQDLGELAVSALAGALIFSLIVFFFLRGNKEVRIVYRNLFLLLLALVAFGIGLDMLDRLFDSEVIESLLKTAEDGGEMLVASFSVWYVYTLYLKDKSLGNVSASK
jgi:hypothetical protein